MKELKSQFGNALLVILTFAAVVAAFINFQQNFQETKRFHLPEDGVTWVDRPLTDGSNAVIALHVAEDSPAARNGIKAGDRLLAIEGTPIRTSTDVIQVLVRLQPWFRAFYTVQRQGYEFNPKLVIGERTPDYSISYQYLVGLAYLVIGMFVYTRRGNAPKALHFLFLCLISFVLSTFHYTGKLNNFDKVIYWGNFAAGLLAPTIFLHFCLTFPEPRPWIKSWFRVFALYTPAITLFALVWAIANGNLRMGISPVELRWLIDRIQMVFLSSLYLLGAWFLNLEYKRADDPIVRQQLKWLRNGAVFGVAPFTAFYVVPYLMGVVPAGWMKLAVLSLPLIPLTWAYAIVRYRLMDVDVIFQQGYVYTLATLAVLGAFYGVFFGLGKVEDLSPTAAIIVVLVAAFVFQPIRNYIQELLDRHVFYRDRYDYRRTLVEFARELSSETDLTKMLNSVADRLIRTLKVKYVGMFLADEEGRFHLQMTHGVHDRDIYPNALDLAFLSANPGKSYLFFERTRHALDVVTREMSPSVRHTISDLDLTYYVPCSVRGRTIAYLGVSRTDEGDFLSSDDVELLVTLSGYVGIAIENARLYHSLQEKVGEYERLKEFSENIVESISVGILAVDLDDRVESWNSQIEKLTCIPRQMALGRTLGELFPAELCEKFTGVRGESGIHNIYKFAYRPISNLLALSGEPANGDRDAMAQQMEDAEREITLNIAIAPLVSKDLKQIGRLIIFDDITERSELERKLVQADKLSSIGMLAAGVAHEVNTPLAVISSYAQMLAKQIPGDDTKSKMLEKIAKQTFRASEIVNSLLNFSRTSKTEFESVDVNRVITETISLVSHQLQKAGVLTHLDLQQNLTPLTANGNKLQQVFLNLVLNARDAMEGRGGTLSIRTWTEQRRVKINVADTGQGIAPENVARIYDPFFTTKTGRKGTGLGLSVTYGIVQEHGGSIEVESQVGAGTLFHLEFPLDRPAAAAASAGAASAGLHEGSPAQLNA